MSNMYGPFTYSGIPPSGPDVFCGVEGDRRVASYPYRDGGCATLGTRAEGRGCSDWL